MSCAALAVVFAVSCAAAFAQNLTALEDRIRQKRQCPTGASCGPTSYVQQQPPMMQYQPQQYQQQVMVSVQFSCQGYMQPTMQIESCMSLVARPDIEDCIEIRNVIMFKIEQKMTWQAAECACRSYGGHLASIENFEEYRALVDFTATGQALWIGLNDLQNEGVFVWVEDNVANLYNAWIPGAPSDQPGHDCALAGMVGQTNVNSPPFIGYGDVYVGFDDYDCNYPAEPLCELFDRD